MLRQASRNDRIAPFHVMALLGRAQALQAAGHDVIHLEVGEPDFPTPTPIMSRAPAPPLRSEPKTKANASIGIIMTAAVRDTRYHSSDS